MPTSVACHTACCLLLERFQSRCCRSLGRIACAQGVQGAASDVDSHFRKGSIALDFANVVKVARLADQADIGGSCCCTCAMQRVDLWVLSVTCGSTNRTKARPLAPHLAARRTPVRAGRESTRRPRRWPCWLCRLCDQWRMNRLSASYTCRIEPLELQRPESARNVLPTKAAEQRRDWNSPGLTFHRCHGLLSGHVVSSDSYFRRCGSVSAAGTELLYE